MLRYFYLLCLVFYIKQCFCYERIYDRSSKLKPIEKRSNRNIDANSRNCNEKDFHVIKRRQGYESSNDNDQFAQIDVASFIKNPDFYADEELLSQQDDLNSQLMPRYNDYNILDNFVMDQSKLNENNKLKANHNAALFKDTMYSNKQNLDISSLNSKNNDFQYNDLKNMFENEISMDNLVHNPLKKSPMQQLNSLKFPFFFRKKNNTSKATDYNYTTNKQQYTMNFNDLMGYSSSDNLSQKDIIKRADKESICLKCTNNKGISKNDKRGLGKTIIHNSRQYYQKIKGDNKNKKITTPQTEKNSALKETVQSKVPVKPNVDTHKQEEKKSYISRHTKANMHKHKEKSTRKKKKLGRKEHVFSNEMPVN